MEPGSKERQEEEAASERVRQLWEVLRGSEQRGRLAWPFRKPESNAQYARYGRKEVRVVFLQGKQGKCDVRVGCINTVGVFEPGARVRVEADT